MQITRKGCEFAAKLLDVERRLRQKAQNATSHLAAAGYAQASLEIAREGLIHFRHCATCQASEAQEAA
jgi:hypothetical protein